MRMNLRRSTRSTVGLRTDDRGTALLEMAIISPVFIALLLGILEFGMVFKTYITVSDTVLDAARIGAVQGPNPTTTGGTADFSIMQSVRNSTGGIPVGDIQRIVVFRAGPAGAGSPLEQVPQACKSSAASVPGLCNVYDPYQAFLAVQSGDQDYFACISAGDPACGWDPDSRNDGPSAAAIDYLGVYVEVDHEMVTGLYGSIRDMDAAAIQRLEPGTVT